jgi:hypothetical protein
MQRATRRTASAKQKPRCGQPGGASNRVGDDLVNTLRRQFSENDSSTEARLGADGKIRHLPRGEFEIRFPGDQEVKDFAPL